ncbi:DMT family transporter [Xylophilus sp.]|uniref:DMT family transporter n=1 Tax=Xylophilus sp. TaxID=2653893 RepID=UPI0013BD948D|nr:EamA family transporter [Xylophilus sp.]KAF1047892.1 MAG: 4-amino-4-deoxy-L-arabinose-phosphoundecaprenol flippase subunit ArnE [Xylophilus sp.]
MKRFYLIGFLVLMAFDTLAQVSFKIAGEQALPLELSPAWIARVFGRPWIYGAFVGYVGAFFTWMTLLRRAPIGPAFAASHLEIISVLAVSVLVFGETIGWPQVAGGLLIVAGIACLAISETGDDAQASADATGHAGTGAAAHTAALAQLHDGQRG